MKKIIIILSLAAVVLFTLLGYGVHKTYQFVRQANNDHQVLRYLFTPDQNGVYGFTGETYRAIQQIQELQKNLATSTTSK